MVRFRVDPVAVINHVARTEDRTEGGMLSNLFLNFANMPHLGKILIIAGLLLVLAGLLVWFAGDKLTWIGHLPGDIRIEKENFRFYFPITTMILLSVILTLILWIVRKLL